MSDSENISEEHDSNAYDEETSSTTSEGKIANEESSDDIYQTRTAPSIEILSKKAQDSEAGLICGTNVVDNAICNSLDPLAVPEHIRARILDSCSGIESTPSNGYLLSMNTYLNVDESRNIVTVQNLQSKPGKDNNKDASNNNSSETKLDIQDNNDNDDAMSVASTASFAPSSEAGGPSSSASRKSNEKRLKLIQGRHLVGNKSSMFDPMIDTFRTAPVSKRVALFTEPEVIVRNRLYSNNGIYNNEDLPQKKVHKDDFIVITETFAKRGEIEPDFGSSGMSEKNRLAYAANGAGTTNLGSVADALQSEMEIDRIRCDICNTLLNSPVTIAQCNHTVCKQCLIEKLRRKLNAIISEDEDKHINSEEDMEWLIAQFAKIVDKIAANPSFSYYLFNVDGTDRNPKEINAERKKLYQRLVGTCPVVGCEEPVVACFANKRLGDLVLEKWYKQPLAACKLISATETLLREGKTMEEIRNMEKTTLPCSCCGSSVEFENPDYEPNSDQLEAYIQKSKKRAAEEQEQRKKNRKERRAIYRESIERSIRDPSKPVYTLDGDIIAEPEEVANDLLLLDELSSSSSESEIGQNDDDNYTSAGCTYCYRIFCGTSKPLAVKCWNEVDIPVHPLSSNVTDQDEGEHPAISDLLNRRTKAILDASLAIDGDNLVPQIDPTLFGIDDSQAIGTEEQQKKKKENYTKDKETLTAIKCTTNCACKRIVEWTAEDLLLRGGFTFITNLFGNPWDVALVRKYLAKQGKILEIEALKELQDELLKYRVSIVKPYPTPSLTSTLLELDMMVCRKCIGLLLNSAVSRYIVSNRENWPKEVLLDRPTCLLGCACELQKSKLHCEKYWHGIKNIVGKNIGFFM